MNCSCTRCCAMLMMVARDGTSVWAMAGPAHRSVRRNAARYFIAWTRRSSRGTPGRVAIDPESAIGIICVPAIFGVSSGLLMAPSHGRRRAGSGRVLNQVPQANRRVAVAPGGGGLELRRESEQQRFPAEAGAQHDADGQAVGAHMERHRLRGFTAFRTRTFGMYLGGARGYHPPRQRDREQRGRERRRGAWYAK